MAACSFWASGFKISSLNFRSTGPKLAALPSLHGLSMTNQKFVLLDGLRISLKPNKPPLIGCVCSTSDTSENSPEDAKSSTEVSKLIPNSFEVESLVTDICDTTSIAEFELKLGGFRLYVKRNLTLENKTLSAPVSSPITVTTAIDLLSDTNGSTPSTSLAVYKSDAGDIQTLLDKATDHGIAILKSPRVGNFRRSRTIKGKLAPPYVEEKQQVEEGQIICFIDQFGSEIPVETNIGGEVIRILREDGEPVGYGDALIAILPSFPGIKKLQ